MAYSTVIRRYTDLSGYPVEKLGTPKGRVGFGQKQALSSSNRHKSCH